MLLECSDKVAIFLGSVGCFQCQGFCFLDYYFSCFGYDICFQVNNECERETFVDNPLQDESFTHVEGNVYENLYSFPPANDSESFQHRGVVVDESNLGEPLGMVLFLLKK